jgi:hypothetical protein
MNAEKKKGETAQSTSEVVLMASKDLKIEDIVWLGDSAATSHLVKSPEGMFDIEECKTQITIGDGNVMTATMCGKLKLTVQQINGKCADIVLTNVNYVPGLWNNLFSITAALRQGCARIGKELLECGCGVISDCSLR